VISQRDSIIKERATMIVSWREDKCVMSEKE